MKIIFWLFVILVVLAPLPFGLVHAFSQAVLAYAVMGLALAWCLMRLKQNKGPVVGLGRVWPEAVGFALVLVWGVVQISTFTPEGWHHPLWAEAGAVLETDVRGSISLARGAGFESLMRLITYGMIFFLAMELGRNRERAEKLFWAITLAGTAYAIYGLIIYFGDHQMVLWVERERTGQSLSGTFINRNNYATYAGLGFICAAGLYLSGFFRALHSRRIGRDRMHHLLQQAFVRGASLLACILILLTALFLSMSRGGVTSTLAALLVLILFLGVFLRMAGPVYKAAASSVLAAGLAVIFFSGEGLLDRLTATDLEREARVLRFEQTWQAIENSPWTGHGIGSYEQSFFLYADERTVTSYKAHNDWLETMFDLGLPAALVWFAVLGGLALRCVMGFFRRGRDHVYPAVAFCACILVGMHSLVDFSLQIPAVAVTFAVLLGVGVSQSWSSDEL